MVMLMLMSYGYKEEAFVEVTPFHILDMFYKGDYLAVIKKIIYVIVIGFSTAFIPIILVFR